jgi:hypothetical protein
VDGRVETLQEACEQIENIPLGGGRRKEWAEETHVKKLVGEGGKVAALLHQLLDLMEMEPNSLVVLLVSGQLADRRERQKNREQRLHGSLVIASSLARESTGRSVLLTVKDLQGNCGGAERRPASFDDGR